jgi:hypothetical protein
MSATALETPAFNKSVFKFGSTAAERADSTRRKPLETAEREAQEAAQRVEAERVALEGRQVAIERQTSKVTGLRNRLLSVEAKDFSKQLSECEQIFDTLFGSTDLSEPNKRLSLESATVALAWIPKAQERQAKLAVALKAELLAAEQELAALEK